MTDRLFKTAGGALIENCGIACLMPCFSFRPHLLGQGFDLGLSSFKNGFNLLELLLGHPKIGDVLKNV